MKIYPSSPNKKINVHYNNNITNGDKLDINTDNFLNREIMIKRAKTFKNEKEKTIKELNINKFCFCFAKKLKNINNILFTEGMNIIYEKMDIIRIIKKLINEDIIYIKIDMPKILRKKLKDCTNT